MTHAGTHCATDSVKYMGHAPIVSFASSQRASGRAHEQGVTARYYEQPPYYLYNASMPHPAFHPTARRRRKRTTVAGLPAPFTHALVLRNPVSTHAEQGKRRIAELKTICGNEHLTVLDTPAGGPEAVRKLLRSIAKRLGPTTLLCVAAGDGTV